MKRLGGAMTMWVLLLSGGAQAATPPSGQADPFVEWSGTISGTNLATDMAYANAGGTHGACPAPLCDTFTLTVPRGGQALTVRMRALSAANNVSIEAVLPDGSTRYAAAVGLEPVATQRRLVIDPAPAGDYTLRLSGEGNKAAGFEFRYGASARIGPEPDLGCLFDRAQEYETGGAPHEGVTDDPLFPQQAGLTQMKVPVAWARGARGSGVTVAVLDTGIDFNHPEFAGRILPGKDYLDGEDGDCAAGPFDVQGHGTHVAGIIAAAAGNGQGIAGVAPEARLLPIRVCSDLACDPDAVNEGIRWAADEGADVINLSLGTGPVPFLLSGQVPDAAMFDAIHAAVGYAWRKGAVVVAGGGNNRDPICMYPGGSPDALCVTAVDRRGLPASYSSLPVQDKERSFGLRAFGGDTVLAADTESTCRERVVSTYSPALSLGHPCGRAYVGLVGTSMASPQVAGAAALLAGLGLSNEQIVARLRSTASFADAPNPAMGHGIPDLDAATKGARKRPCRRTSARRRGRGTRRPSRSCGSAHRWRAPRA